MCFCKGDCAYSSSYSPLHQTLEVQPASHVWTATSVDGEAIEGKLDTSLGSFKLMVRRPDFSDVANMANYGVKVVSKQSQCDGESAAGFSDASFLDATTSSATFTFSFTIGDLIGTSFKVCLDDPANDDGFFAIPSQDNDLFLRFQLSAAQLAPVDGVFGNMVTTVRAASPTSIVVDGVGLTGFGSAQLKVFTVGVENNF